MDEFYHQIEPYLLDLLNEPERRAFEAQLAKDEALAQSVEAHRTLIKRMEGARVRTKVNNAIQAYKKQDRRNLTSIRPAAWALAATVVLLLAAVWFFTRPDAPAAPQMAVEQPVNSAPQIPDPVKDTVVQPAPPAQPDQSRTRALAMAKSQFVPPTSTMIRDAMESTANAPRTPFHLAGEAYMAKDYKKAASLLANENLVSNDENARFLRAGARFKAGQYALAAGDYQKLMNSFEFKHEARWNEMLCQMAIGKPVDSLLKKMASDENFAFKSKAKQLEQSLRNNR